MLLNFECYIENKGKKLQVFGKFNVIGIGC